MNSIVKVKRKTKTFVKEIPNKIRGFFRFQDVQATFKKEFLGGIVTALSMIYIFALEPGILSGAKSINAGAQNMQFGGIFIATAITTFTGTIIMGLISNMPVALAPGMGLNVIFTFNIANGPGHLGYEGALITVMFSAVIFTIITICKLRYYILQTISPNMRKIIGLGVGFFIAYVGLADIGFVAQTPGGVPAAKLANLSKNWPSILMGVFVFSLILIFSFQKKIPGSIFIALVIGIILSVILGNTITNPAIKNQFSVWKGWSYNNFSGFKSNLSSTFSQFGKAKVWISPTFYISILILAIISFFDATGTLYSVTNQIADSTGTKYEVTHKALIGDSVGGFINGFIGVSNSTTYIESTTGVAEGARTGFSSLVTAMVFAIAVPLYPLFALVTINVSGGILIYIGVLMMRQIDQIEWKEPEYLVAGFTTIITTVVTYTITTGFAVGFLMFSLACAAQRKWHKLNITTLILDIIFVGYFVSFAFLQNSS